MEFTDHNTGEVTNVKRRNKKNNFDLSSMVYGKVPPQAKDLEEAILGGIMLDSRAIDQVLEWLQPESFYVESHQRIFQAMINLTNKSQPIDILTVAEELRKTEELEMVGGPYYITKLTNSVVSSANIQYHSQIILQKFIQREIIRVGGNMIGEGYEDASDVFDLLDHVEQNVYAITNKLHNKGFRTIDTLVVGVIRELETIRQNPDNLSGVTSGFPSVDKLTHGWQNTDLIVLAARPAVGKTAFALNLAVNAAKAKKPVALFSLEMSAPQLIKRILSCESEIWLEKITKGRIEEHEMRQLYDRGVKIVSQLPLIIDDTAALNIFELRAKARRLKNKYNIELIIVDYLQLMSGTKSAGQRNREGEISEISRGLKALAKELNVPIIALSQLNRETEKRSDNTPKLSDLRESGAIEQDADAVLFMYRPEYYGIHHNVEGESNPGETIINFAKYRNGATGKVTLKAQLHIQKFVEKDSMPVTAYKAGEERLSVPVTVGSQLPPDDKDLPF